jgi:hypothetical protein
MEILAYIIIYPPPMIRSENPLQSPALIIIIIFISIDPNTEYERMWKVDNSTNIRQYK